MTHEKAPRIPDRDSLTDDDKAEYVQEFIESKVNSDDIIECIIDSIASSNTLDILDWYWSLFNIPADQANPVVQKIAETSLNWWSDDAIEAYHQEQLDRANGEYDG